MTTSYAPYPYTRADHDDDMRKEVPDPGYAGEIAMLEASLIDPVWKLTGDAIKNARERIEWLRMCAKREVSHDR